MCGFDMAYRRGAQSASASASLAAACWRWFFGSTNATAALGRAGKDLYYDVMLLEMSTHIH